MTDINPTSVRVDLATQREQGIPFHVAWTSATEAMAPDDSLDRALLKFMRKHFEAAYYDKQSPEGRCNVPGRDVSHAVGMPVEHPRVIPGRGRCRSGDGCERRAERGRFGTYWCGHHASELEHLTVKLKLDVDKANPRKT